MLITDQANERVIEVNSSKQIVFQYGVTGVSGIGLNLLNNPNSAEQLKGGDILIADENNNRVIELTRSGHVVWQYPTVLDPSKLSGAAFASRLDDGNTLITIQTTIGSSRSIASRTSSGRIQRSHPAETATRCRRARCVCETGTP